VIFISGTTIFIKLQNITDIIKIYFLMVIPRFNNKKKGLISKR